MLRLISILLLSLLPARACLWDRDTLLEEAKGKLDTVKAITGWFDRYPPRYYEMRLERVANELAADPAKLDLYDDAGVACSRLGRHDEAIAWMQKKQAALAAKPPAETTEARYRYLSNIGTFHLVRWMTKPEAERIASYDDLRTSESLIAQALDLNPDAHFGREKFQLMLIRWLLSPGPKPDDYDDANFLNLPESLSSPPRGAARPSEGIALEEARLGITGLIQLGAAWQSVDVFQTLQICLHSERNGYLARLAYLRKQELLSAGMKSLHPSEKVQEQISQEALKGAIYGEENIDRFYCETRAAANQRETAWIAYQEQRFAKGMHPDTHPDFWSGWQEPAFPELPGPTFGQRVQKNPGSYLTAMFIGFVLGIWGLAKGIKKLMA